MKALFVKAIMLLILIIWSNFSYGQLLFQKDKVEFKLNKSYNLPLKMTKPIKGNIVFEDIRVSGVKIPDFKHAAFFCKMEDRIYSKTKMNLKINLGSHEYVNFLEGKHKIP
jgi:hypothetical protein